MKLSMEEAQEMMRKDGGNLYLDQTQYTGLPEGLSVPGDLDISWSAVSELPENLYVGGSLYANRTCIRRLPDGIIIGENLWMQDAQVTTIPDDMIVGGSIVMTGSPLESIPDNFVVPGTLDIRGTKIRKLPQGLVVGWILEVSYCHVRRSRFPSDMKVGMCVDYTDKDDHQYQDRDSYSRFINGEYVPGRYLYADGILTHVAKAVPFGDYTVYIGKIPGRHVVADGVDFANCSSIREGMEELAYQKARRDYCRKYRNFSRSDSLPVDDLVIAYRAITGTCRGDVKRFREQMDPVKDSYTIQEAIDLTRGQYGAEEFARFFAA